MPDQPSGTGGKGKMGRGKEMKKSALMKQNLVTPLSERSWQVIFSIDQYKIFSYLSNDIKIFVLIGHGH